MHLASHPPSVRSPGAHQMLAGLVFQRHGGFTEPLNTKKNIRFLGNICTYTEKPKFSIGTDVARSSLCPGRPRFASQIASVATPGAHQVVAGILLLHQVGPTRHLMMSKVSKTYDCPRLHPYLHSPPRLCLATCKQRPCSHYVMGGGWELYKQ